MTRWRTSLRDLGIAVSLANLCHLRIWAMVLCPPAVVRSQHAAAIANTLIVALVLWGLVALGRSTKSRMVLDLARLGLLLALLLSLPSIACVVWPAFRNTRTFYLVTAVVFFAPATAITAATLTGRGALLSSLTCRGLLALVPAAFVTMGQSAWYLVAPRAIPAPAAIARPLGTTVAGRPLTGQRRPRVVIVLLDELDYGVAFASRPPSLKLPALDRLRQESLWASNAYPPHYQTTHSVPASLTGRLVDDAHLTPDGGLMVRFQGSKEMVPLGAQQTLFSEVKRRGMRSLTISYSDWLPYPRVFTKDARCIDPRRHTPLRGWFFHDMLAQLVTLTSDAPVPGPRCLAEAWMGLHKQAAARDYGAFMAAARQGVVDTTADLIFLHAMVPHGPFIFDRQKGVVTVAHGTTYLDNVALADRTLAQLRSALEAERQWDSATVLVLSDHWWRDEDTPDHRVPFLLKLGGQRAGVQYAHPFNTVLLRDLVLAILQGGLRNASDVVSWLDRHRTFGESPLTAGFKAGSQWDRRKPAPGREGSVGSE